MRKLISFLAVVALIGVIGCDSMDPGSMMGPGITQGGMPGMQGMPGMPGMSGMSGMPMGNGELIQQFMTPENMEMMMQLIEGLRDTTSP